MQSELFTSLVTARKIAVFGGYSWGYAKILEQTDYAAYISGLVITPRWISHLMSEQDEQGIARRLIVDNGAYPAFVRGEALAFEEQITGIHRALELRIDAEWIVAPDVVADAAQTWTRLKACALELERYGLDRLLLPIQDGMSVERLVSMARDYGAGVFVGGSTWKYKIAALRELSKYKLNWLHVGRASSYAQLEAAAALGVDSVDSTSFLRRYMHNVDKREVYGRNLQAFASKR